MPGNDPYNSEVRRRFENPVHAGDLAGRYDEILTADVSEAAQGTRVCLAAGIAADTVREIRFRAWGCPHLLAAADLYCEMHEGEPVEALAAVDVNELMARLSVPIGKTGRLLLIQDAARALAHSDR